MARALKTLNQFLLDVPRVGGVVVDGELQKGHPVELFLGLSERFGPQIGLRFADRCTQGWLAHWYSVGVDRFCREPGTHLLSDGYQHIAIRSHPEPHLATTKPFSIVKMGKGGDVVEREPAILALTYTPGTVPHTHCQWLSGDDAREWTVV